MRRIGAIAALVVFLFVMTAGACFAATDSLKIKDVYPKDGAKGTSVDNLSIKLYFDRDVMPKNAEVKKANKKAFKLVDEKGKEIDIMVKYNPDKDKKGQVIVLANAVSATSGDKKSKKTKIQSNTKYTFSISKNFVATDGSKLDEDKKISFTTVNQAQATKIQMLLMGVMVAVMVIMSMRSQKKQQEKEEEEKRAKNKKSETVNPYKVAKASGKSVEEIVRKDQEKKAKQEKTAEKHRAKQEKQRQKIEEHIRKKYGSDNYRVHKARPISEAGSSYVHKTAKVEEVQTESKSKSTNPKQSGKQKNKKNK